MSLLDRFRDWLEARGWWYGRLKPCDCPRSERYWGLSGHPPDAEMVDSGSRRVETETDAALIVEWKATRTWRCRRCGESWTEHLGVTVERDVRWHEPASEVATR